jgi:nitrite reductase/ring-hydroxylating ferredoxin subunit
VAGSERLICAAADLRERGTGVRFTVMRYGQKQAAFAVRFGGVVRAYLNRCAHVPIELDWAQGEFFDLSGLYLVCSTHGAAYDPQTGRCRGGPCGSRGLIALQVEERDGGVFLIDDNSEMHHD